MNKADLINRVAKKTGLSKKDAGLAVETMIESISEALKDGEKVSLVGFGNFEVRERAARAGRDPRTGEAIQIPARRVPAFRAGKNLREVVNI